MKRERVLQKAAFVLAAIVLMIPLFTGTMWAEETQVTEETISEVEFASCRLLVRAKDASIFPEDAPILSSYNDLYLLQFADEQQTEEACRYYQELAEMVEADVGILVCEEDAGEMDDLMTEDHNPLSELEEIMKEEESGRYDIALIDTGANNTHVVKAVSMIGEDPSDDNGHGTRMARFIAEENDDARILSIKAMDASGRGDLSAVYAAIEYAISQEVKIISLSASARVISENIILRDMVRRVVDQGIWFVGSAGNEGSDAADYIPGNIEAAIIIGACDAEGRRIPSSNYGATVDYYIPAESTSEAAARFSGRLSLESMETLLLELNQGFLFTESVEVGEEGAVYYQTDAEGNKLPDTDFRAAITQQFYSVQGLGENDVLYYTYVNGVMTPAYCIDHGKMNPNGDYYSYSATTNNILGYIMRNGYPNRNWGLSWQEAQFLTQAAVFGALGVPLYEVADGQHAPYWIWNHIWGDGWYTEGDYLGSIGHFQYAVDLLDQARQNASASDANYVNFWTPSSGTYQRMITPSRATTSVKVIKTTSAGTACTGQLEGNAMYSSNFSGAAFQVSIYDAYSGSWSASKTYETGSDGSFTISGLFVGDKVRAEEIRPPKGYRLPSQTMQEITISETDNQITFRDAPIFAKNVPVVRKVTYADGELNTEETIKDAVFRMEYFDNDSCSGSAVRTWYFRTGSNGTFTYSSNDLAAGRESDALYTDVDGRTNLPLGSIKITEVECPRGYRCYDSAIKAKILRNDSTGEAAFSWITKSGGPIRLNTDGTAVIGDEEIRIVINKVDASTGRSLSGAHLQLLEGNGAVYEWDTAGKEQMIRKLLLPGKTYTIRETKAPGGYKKAEDILFRVGSDGAITVQTADAELYVSEDGVTGIRMKDSKMICMPASGSTAGLAIFLIGFLLFCGGAGTGACFLAKRKCPKIIRAVVTAGICLLTLGILSSPILADGNLLIKEEEENGHIYAVYQLFSGSVIDEDILWDVQIAEDIPDTLWDRLGVDPKQRASTQIAKWLAEQIRSDTDGRFAVAVAKAVLEEKDVQPDAEAIAGEPILLPDGYYLFVSDDAQPVLALIGNGKTLAIREKSDLPTVKKEIGEVHTDGTVTYGKSADTGFGKVVPYRITGTIHSNYNAYESYAYCFRDHFDPGLTINPDSVIITVRDAEGKVKEDITKDAEITITEMELAAAFMDLKKAYSSYTDGDVLVLEYDAYLKEGCSIGSEPNRNEVWIEYTKSPVCDQLGKSLPDECRLYTWKLELRKVASDSKKPLSKASFTICDEAGLFLNTDGTMTRQKSKDSLWKTDAEGKLQVSGVDSGRYTVKEETAPKGYLPAEEFVLSVSAEYPKEDAIVLTAESSGTESAILHVDAKMGTILFEVTDLPEPETPKTGDRTNANGYWIAMASASVVFLSGIAYALHLRKKKKEQKSTDE